MKNFILNKTFARIGGYAFLILSCVTAFVLIEWRSEPFLFGASLALLLTSLFISGILWGVLFALEKRITWI